MAIGGGIFLYMSSDQIVVRALQDKDILMRVRFDEFKGPEVQPMHCNKNIFETNAIHFH